MRTPSTSVTDPELFDFYRRVGASDIPVYSLVPGEYPKQIFLSDKITPGWPRVVVITIPRSGTHLTSKLLAGMGMIYGGLHLAPSLETDLVEDRRGLNISAMGKVSFRRYRLPLEDAFRMLGPGQFVQGHIPYQENFVAALAGCKIVYVERNLRDVAVSSMRFIASLTAAGHVFAEHLDTRWVALENGPLKMHGYLQSFGTGLPVLSAAIEPWRREDNAFTLDFDRLTGADRHAALQSLTDLAWFLDIPADTDTLSELLAMAVGAETLTWTGKLSRWRQVWSDEVEAAFQSNVLLPASPSRTFQHAIDTLPGGHPAPEEWKACSTLSWLTEDRVAARTTDTNPEYSRESFMTEVLSDRLKASVDPGPLDLDTIRVSWVADGVALEQDGEWLTLSSSEASSAGHKHLGVPIPIVEPLTAVTFGVVVHAGHTDRWIMLQVGDEQGFFSSVFDVHALANSQIQQAGGCRSLCARIGPVGLESVQVAICGLAGIGAAPYARIYLCGASGQLNFTGPMRLQVKTLTLSYGLQIFDTQAKQRRGGPGISDRVIS